MQFFAFDLDKDTGGDEQQSQQGIGVERFVQDQPRPYQ